MAEYTPSDYEKKLWANRLGMVVMAIIMGIAFTGLVVGIRAGKTLGPTSNAQDDYPLTNTPKADEAVDENRISLAPTYAHIGKEDYSANRKWQNALDKLEQTRPDLFAPVQTSPELKAQSLTNRESTRAYNGAPPVVPHPIDQRTATSCLACHQNGIKVGNAIAAPLPHPAYQSCTQCHVEAKNNMFPKAVNQPLTGSNFKGVPAPTGGKRAWTGAPPTIPHSTWMRQNCNACHGQLGEPGLRTTHPWRNNCVQCHAPSADNDQFTTSPNFSKPPPIFTSGDADDE